MSADLLRRAAAKIRKTAAEATPGPWMTAASKYVPGTYVHQSRQNGAQIVHATSIKRPDAEHVALWSPDVAELAAQVLDSFEAVYRASGDAVEPESPVGRLARRILGEDA